MSEFNQNNHPEIKVGEVFHCNTANHSASQVHANSKRVGNIAYNTDGVEVQGLVPVFISFDDEAKMLIRKFKGMQSNFDFFSNERKLCFRAIRFLNLTLQREQTK